MQWSFENKVALWFMAAATILGVVGLVSYRTLTGLAEDAHLVAHSHQVIERLNHLHDTVEAAEDAQRGYMLTGNLRYMQQYEDAPGVIASDVKGLASLLADNPAQAQRLHSLTNNVATRMAFLRTVLNHYETEGTQGSQAAQRAIASSQGQSTMDSVTNDSAQMQHVEDELLQVRSAKVASSTRQATLTSWAGIGMSFLILGFVYYLISHEMSQRQRAEQALTVANVRLDALATLDGLTGVKNRRALQERLTAELARSTRYTTPFSLLLLDIDKFKQYNDTFGHQAGDEVLRGMGRLLQHQARTTDVVARYGGEEFMLLLPNTDAAGSLAMAEHLRGALESASWPHRAVTASFGAATLNGDIATETALIEAADRALYAAKNNGRNRVTHACHLAAAEGNSKGLT